MINTWQDLKDKVSFLHEGCDFPDTCKREGQVWRIVNVNIN